MQLTLPPELFIPPTAVAPNLSFRLAQPDDELLLYKTFYPDQRWAVYQQHFQQMGRWARRGRCFWLVAQRQSQLLPPELLATGQLLLYPHGSEIANLQVAPNERGQSLGTALVEILTAVAHHLHLPYLEISVAQNNSQALALYQRLGFAIDRHLKQPQGEPAYVLVKKL